MLIVCAASVKGLVFLMRRHRVRSVRRDKRVFRRTARSARKINLEPRIMRGGIRL